MERVDSVTVVNVIFFVFQKECNYILCDSHNMHIPLAIPLFVHLETYHLWVNGAGD